MDQSQSYVTALAQLQLDTMTMTCITEQYATDRLERLVIVAPSGGLITALVIMITNAYNVCNVF